MNGYVFKLCSIYDRRGSRNFRQRGSNLREKFDKQKTKEEGGRFSVYSAYKYGRNLI